MTPEGRVKKKVKEVLNELGAYYTMPVTGGYGGSGAPDFIICIGGLFYGIECKANGGKPTALQLKHHDDIRKAGGIALVVDEADHQVVESRIHAEADRPKVKGKAAVRVYRAVAE
jgi:hypothetical protein